ncbi:MAG: hypothetical protein ACLTOZ_07865 [[Clostridium] leptum]|nr:hypothetical protein [Clostridiaceae bacterium]
MGNGRGCRGEADFDEPRALLRRGLSGKALIIRRKFRECDNEAPVFLPYVYQM